MLTHTHDWLTDDNTDSGLVVRKCFRMVGGVLVERTVKDVLPALVSNRDKMGRSSNLRIWGTHVTLLGKLIESLDKQLADKGADINGYMEKHNIQLKDQQGGAKKDDKSGAGDSKSGGGVLVA